MAVGPAAAVQGLASSAGVDANAQATPSVPVHSRCVAATRSATLPARDSAASAGVGAIGAATAAGGWSPSSPSSSARASTSICSGRRGVAIAASARCQAAAKAARCTQTPPQHSPPVLRWRMHACMYVCMCVCMYEGGVRCVRGRRSRRQGVRAVRGTRPPDRQAADGTAHQHGLRGPHPHRHSCPGPPTHTHTYIYLYTHMHIHTYTYIYIYAHTVRAVSADGEARGWPGWRHGAVRLHCGWVTTSGAQGRGGRRGRPWLVSRRCFLPQRRQHIDCRRVILRPTRWRRHRHKSRRRRRRRRRCRRRRRGRGIGCACERGEERAGCLQRRRHVAAVGRSVQARPRSRPARMVVFIFCCCCQ
jgi:hypothetical protein